MFSRAKAAGWILVILACCAFLAWRFRPLGPIERTLSRLPLGLAIEAYVAPAAMHRAQGRLRAADLAFADGADALALGLGPRQIYAVATGGFDAADLRAKLQQAAVPCPPEFPAAPCVGIRERDWLSVALLDHDLLGFSYGAARDGVSSLREPGDDPDAKMDRVRRDIRAGALVWAAVRARSLDRIMASPPEGWINLSLVARALLNAPVAYLTLRPDPLANSLLLELEAPCTDEAAGAELRGILEELNRFALKLAEKQENPEWKPLLESLNLRLDEATVTATWSLHEQDIAKIAP